MMAHTIALEYYSENNVWFLQNYCDIDSKDIDNTSTETYS